MRSSSYSGSWKLPARELSEDPLLLEVAGQRKSSIHAAMTASAFTTFMTTFPGDLTAGWEVPVLLTSMNTKSASESASVPCSASEDRVAFFDKPLLPRSLTLRQKHERVYKSAVTALSIGVGGKGGVSAKSGIAADRQVEGVPRHVADVVVTGTNGQGVHIQGAKLYFEQVAWPRVFQDLRPTLSVSELRVLIKRPENYDTWGSSRFFVFFCFGPC